MDPAIIIDAVTKLVIALGALIGAISGTFSLLASRKTSRDVGEVKKEVVDVKTEVVAVKEEVVVVKGVVEVVKAATDGLTSKLVASTADAKLAEGIAQGIGMERADPMVPAKTTD